MEVELALEFARVVEQAAIEAARTMGRGDRELSDRAAVEAMRRVLDAVPVAGTVVIGEGERDQAPMLYIGEKVGLKKEYCETVPEVDIAVDPLEGTNLCAMGVQGAITVLAASEQGGLLHAPDCYMEKIVVEPGARGAVELDAPVKEKLSGETREAGARIRLISDGDLSAGIAAAVVGTGVHAVMGIGGAPEGVLTAAALRCLNGEILARLVVKDEQQAERIKSMGIHDLKRIYNTHDLAPGKEIIFAACGVTDGSLLKGVRFFGEGVRTQSMVMTLSTRCVRFIDSIHMSKRPDAKVRLF